MVRLPRLRSRHLTSILGTVRRATRYDFVLFAIPAAFLFSGVLSSAMAVEPVTALTAASMLSTIAVFDALFLNPPKGPRTGTRTS